MRVKIIPEKLLAVWVWPGDAGAASGRAEQRQYGKAEV